MDMDGSGMDYSSKEQKSINYSEYIRVRNIRRELKLFLHTPSIVMEYLDLDINEPFLCPLLRKWFPLHSEDEILRAEKGIILLEIVASDMDSGTMVVRASWEEFCRRYSPVQRVIILFHSFRSRWIAPQFIIILILSSISSCYFPWQKPYLEHIQKSLQLPFVGFVGDGRSTFAQLILYLFDLNDEPNYFRQLLDLRAQIFSRPPHYILGRYLESLKQHTPKHWKQTLNIIKEGIQLWLNISREFSFELVQCMVYFYQNDAVSPMVILDQTECSECSR